MSGEAGTQELGAGPTSLSQVIPDGGVMIVLALKPKKILVQVRLEQVSVTL